ncbi:hypothetical protein BXZ70DRAFT_743123 [Cristinia sonorae]|uniref:Uncharacterized protein n=1 Tax=Cristinia sonorae TaxID=1940300 RepID=A0A8K0XSB9_9AGAR|nr:hypothetical protein BXZ70DRAFT_743123 [Cristinia sonorae]
MVPTITRATVIATDLAVIIAILSTTMQTWTLQSLREMRPALTTIFLRDGIVYFLVMAILNTVNLVLDQAPSLVESQGSNFVAVLDAIGSTVIARFILDLRTASSDAAGPSIGGSMSELRFGQVTVNLAGNIGARMEERSTWLVSANEDLDDEIPACHCPSGVTSGETRDMGYDQVHGDRHFVENPDSFMRATLQLDTQEAGTRAHMVQA